MDSFEKLEAAKTTKSFVLNGQRLTDVPHVVLEDEWCQQHLQSLYLKNNLICRVVSYNIVYNYREIFYLLKIESKNKPVKVIDTNVSMLIKIYYFVPNVDLCALIGHWRTTSLKNCHLVCVAYHFFFVM